MKLPNTIKSIFQFVFYSLFLVLENYSYCEGQSITIGTGTSLVTNLAGEPIFRLNSTSTINHAKSIQLLTVSQLQNEGLPNGALINTWGYKRLNSSIPSGTNSWALNVYLKNSSASSLASGTSWSSMISTATLVYTATINSSTMPANNGFWMWNLNTPFAYTGNAIECYVEWIPNGTLVSPYTTGGFSWEYTASTSNQSMGIISTNAIASSASSWTTSTNMYNTRIDYTTSLCTGTPIGGTATSSFNSVCSNQATTLSVSGSNPIYTGITFQWQSSTDPSFSTYVTNLGTTSSISVTQNQTSYYRRITTCTGSGQSAYSTIVQVNMTSFLQCYCSSIHSSGCLGDAITNVSLNGWSNNTGQLCPVAPAYSYFNAGISQTTLQQSGTYSLVLTFGSNSSQYAGAWIDYNMDGQFSASECIGLAGNAGANGTSTITFTVPQSASGLTRLRIIGGNDYPVLATQACGASSDVYGETEDYDITIGYLCSSAIPNLGNTLSTATSVCYGSSVTLSTQGLIIGGNAISVQWQCADDANFSTNAINLGTAATQNVIITSNKYYRCKVTVLCNPSHAVGISNPLLVSLAPAPAGSSLSNPILVGQAPCSSQPFIDVKTNSTANCFSNSFGQASPEIYYQFTLASPATLEIGHCGSYMDTYIHLLNSAYTTLATNDDNGPICPNQSSASLSVALGAGTYYVVSEGYSTNAGAITTTINTTDACTISLNLTCYLQGCYLSSGLMKSVLMNEGISTSTIDCDSVTVELHNASTPFALISSYTGLLHTDGTLTCIFPYSILSGTYYIVVKQRNHIETWSASPLNFSTPNISYNFSNAANKAYGNNQIEVESGVYAIYAGDINQDEVIDGSDVVDIENGTESSAFGYNAADLNGDGSVDGSDYPIWDANAGNSIYSVHP